MIYLPEVRALFVHNPKCAGTALTQALESAWPEAVRLWGRGYDPRTDCIRDLAHLTLQEAAEALGPDAPIDYAFGVVRDPYARFVSALKHFNRHSGYRMPFSADTFIDRFMNHTTIRCDWRFVHFAPQYRFFLPGVRPIDHVGRVETLPAFTSTLSERLGRPIDPARENVGDTIDVALSDFAVAAINHFYARDFAQFGYPMRASPVDCQPTCARSFYGQFEDLWPEERGLDASPMTME